MKCRYLINDKKIWLEIIDSDNPILNINSAKVALPSTLLGAIKSSRVTHLYLTPTFPIVYLRTGLPEGLSMHTYSLKYRLFLNLASCFTQYNEIDSQPDWFRYGF